MSAAAHRFDEARVLRRVAKSCPKFCDRRAEAVIEIDERIGRPQRLTHFFAGDEIAVMVEEKHQQLERLLLKLDSDALLAELSRAPVDFVDAKAHDAPFGGRHGAADISASAQVASSNRTGDALPDLIGSPMVARTTTDERQMISGAWTRALRRRTVASGG